MILKSGNMWDELGKCDLILFTANSTTKNGRLIMGGGAAKEALTHYPDSDKVFGEILDRNKLSNEVFGLMFPYAYYATTINGSMLGAFQTKTKVWEPSTLGMVEYSIHLLHGVAHNWERIVLNMPGTGLGGLKEADVLPMIETLPDNVTVYTFTPAVVQANNSAQQIANKLAGQLLTGGS